MEILDQIRKENKISMSALEWTLERKRTQIEGVFKFKKSWNKINSNLILAIKQQMMASYYADEITQSFDLWYLYEDIADNLNNTAKSSYYDMNMTEINARVESDRFDYGVWIIIDQWWEDECKNPMPYVVSPLSRRPDPLVKDNEQEARRHWFTTSISCEELENMEWMDIDSLKRVKDSLINATRQLDDAYAQAQGSITSSMLDDVTVYNHYTTYKGKKIWCLCDENMTEVLMSKEIKIPKKHNKAYRPINITWFFPWNWPFGYSGIDLLEDKQVAKDLLMNLKKLRAKKEAMWWDIVVDINYLDPYSFLEQKDETRIHPVDPIDNVTWQRIGLDSMIHQPQQERFTFQLMDSMSQDIEQSAFISSWISAQSLWVPSDKNMTATESQTVQANANLRIRFWLNYQRQAQKRFWWNIWYRSMLIHFSDSDEKYVNINTWIYTETKMFSRSDIISNIEPRLSIESAIEKKTRNAQEFAQSQVFFQSIIADPNIATRAKRQVMRKIGRLLGYGKIELESFLLPQDPKEASDEQKIRDHIVLINAGEVPYMAADENHTMFKFYYQRCEDWPTKAKALAKRDYLITTLWQQQAQLPQEWWWMMNSANNIMMSQLTKTQPNSL